jgi:dTDP-L-rhamnose 4-epimerase
VKVLLTGAAGFIGSATGAALQAGGHEVVGLDLMLPLAHPADASVPDGLHRIDVGDRSGLAPLLADVDVVCHQAAMVGNGVDADDLPEYVRHNDLGTAVLLAAMAACNVDRLVLASSMVVYGEGAYRCRKHGAVPPRTRSEDDLRHGIFDPRCASCESLLDWETVEETAPLAPRSIYAATKAAQEHLATAWATLRGGRAIALRYHNVYGPHMPADTPYAGVAAIFRSALARGAPPQVFEDGRQVRDFVHVSDVAAANVAAVERVGEHPVGLHPYNVCSGQPVTLLEMAQAIASGARGPEPVVTGRYRPADVRHVVASPRRASDGLGFSAAVHPVAGFAAFGEAPLRPAGERATPRG